ncbi:MAG: LytTR family DNA-binding domain-containing protein [Aliidongia sp.]
MAERPPLRTLIADDEPLAIERMQILCARLPELHLIGTALDGAAALRLAEALEPDLLLLDIAMPGLDGLGVARALEGAGPRRAVIFVTAFDHFAIAAFDVAAVDYLLKPVEQSRLERAVARVRGLIDAGPVVEKLPASPWTQEFWVPHRAEIIRILAHDIDLIEAERDYMRLHLGPRSYLLHQTIGELERRLDPMEFIRLHRSTIVRRERIAGFKRDGEGAWLAELTDGRLLRVGRTYLQNTRAMVER